MIEILLSIPKTLQEKRRIWNANNYRWNRRRILKRKELQRRKAGILPRAEWEKRRRNRER